ncbi:MAG: hypothetical protein R2724_08260 [Bryobacterales bacterium]
MRTSAGSTSNGSTSSTQLAPEVAQLVEAGRSAARNEKTPIGGFPNYRTMFQGGKMEVLAMSPGEANLLADFTS